MLLVVKASVLRVRGNAQYVSGHSLRVGCCTPAATAGFQRRQIREQTGHKSAVTHTEYVRRWREDRYPAYSESPQHLTENVETVRCVVCSAAER